MQHEAGRALDRLIAEKVMGWRRGGANDHTRPAHVKETRKRPGEPETVVDVLDWGRKGPHDYLMTPCGEKLMLCDCETPPPRILLPEYSTDIAAAWEVVVRMNALGWIHCRIFHEGQDTPPSWWAWFGMDIYLTKPRHEHEAVSADTAPLAICLAALKAVQCQTTNPSG